MTTSLGTYYDQVKAGRCFIGSTAAAGTTLPLASGTAMTFGVWNVNAKKNVVPLLLNIGFTSGTIALGQFGLTQINAGFSIGTGAPISAFTDGAMGSTIRNAIMGGGGSPTARFTPSAATVAAATVGYWIGSSFPAAAAVDTSLINHDFKGAVICPPGCAIFLSGSIAQTALFSISIVWAEVDV